MSDQGEHFINNLIRELTSHYAIVHKKSAPYYPQANGLAESTNKTLQTILKKIVNDNRIDWDERLHSTLWAYRTIFKTSIGSTPFRLVFGLEAVMPIEFQVPSLSLQITDQLPESESEHQRLTQLLKLGKQHIHNMAQLEHGQRRRKVFVDRHCHFLDKKFEIGQPV